MSSLFAAQWPKLSVLGTLKKKSQQSLRTALLREFSKDADFCRALRVIAKNLLRRKVPLTSRDCCRLKKHKSTIHALYRKGQSTRTKRKLAVQSGGFLAVALPLVTTIIGELIRSSGSSNA